MLNFMTKKQLTLSIIAVIILALIGGGIFWYWNKYQGVSTKGQGSENQPAEIVNTEDLSSIALGTEDWLTYRNEEYGFEVKYPRRWLDKFNQSQSFDPQFKNLFYRDIWGDTQKEGTEFFDGAYIRISVLQDRIIDLEKFVKEKYTKDQIEKTLLNNILSYQIIRKANAYDSSVIKDSYIRDTFFQYKDSIYRITAYAIGKDYLQFISQLNILLSSFNVI